MFEKTLAAVFGACSSLLRGGLRERAPADSRRFRRESKMLPQLCWRAQGEKAVILTPARCSNLRMAGEGYSLASPPCTKRLDTTPVQADAAPASGIARRSCRRGYI